MLGFVGRWLSQLDVASQRMESAARSLERSTGKLEAVIDRSYHDQSEETKKKSEKLRKDLDKLSH